MTSLGKTSGNSYTTGISETFVLSLKCMVRIKRNGFSQVNRQFIILTVPSRSLVITSSKVDSLVVMKRAFFLQRMHAEFKDN